jgi:opacity protein-like surface antigen
MKRVLGTVAVLLAAGIPVLTHAQAPVAASPITVAIMGGAAMPMGDLDDIGDMGFNLGAGVEFGVSSLPFGLRAELAYTRFGAWDISSPDGSLSIRPSNLAVTLNAVVGPTVPAATVRPYFIGGLGFYNAKFDVDATGDEIDISGSDSKGGFGLNGGAGVRFQFVGFSSFIEARYHHMFKGMPDIESADESWTSAGYLPIVFGISIGG